MKLMIIGASGHGKVVADIAEKNGYNDIEFYDDDYTLTHCGKWPVVGTTENIDIGGEIDLFVAVGNNEIRKKLIEKYSNSNIVTLIHPDAVLADEVDIGRGTIVQAGAVIDPYVKLGKGCIINKHVSISHDCNIGNYIHTAPGSRVCGTVKIGDETWIGAGATVINNVNVCGHCMIGAGAVVVNNIEVSGTYVGVPARLIKK